MTTQEKLTKLLQGSTITGFKIGEFNEWNISFSGQCAIICHCLCRFLSSDGTILMSSDHKQKYGLPEPIDAEVLMKKKIISQLIKSIKIVPGFNDLIINMPNGELQIICSSSGFENYILTGPDHFLLPGRPGDK